jgi:O-antigen/teichoic acid export membrane protein
LTPLTTLKALWGSLRHPAHSGTILNNDAYVRDSERNRRAALSGITAATARVVQLGASLITVPLTMHYLGTERFGLWMTVSSFATVAAFADFGLGNGLLQMVAKSHGRDDIGAVKGAVSSAFAALSILCGCLLLLFFCIYRFISWADLFRVVSPQSRSEAGPAMLAFAVCFAISLPAGVVQRTQVGLQQGFRANAWQLIGSILGLVALISAIWARASLPVLIIALLGSPLIAAGLNTVRFFFVTSPELSPCWRLVSKRMIRQITSIGILFFCLQVAVAAGYSADNIVVARTLGASSVPDYAVPQRMFGMIAIMISMFVSPLWPAYGEAISRGDIIWVRSALLRSVCAVLLISTVTSAILLLFSYRLVHWWVGPSISPPLLLLVGLAIWTVMESTGNALSVFLNGSGFINFQIVVACIFGASCISAKVYLTRHFGIAGLPWATIFTAGFLSYIPLAFYVRYKLERIDRSHGEGVAAA